MPSDPPASATKYYNALERAVREVNTLKHDIQHLYNQGLELLRGDDDLIYAEKIGEKLEDILNVVENGLWNKTKAYLKVDPSIHNDTTRKAMLMDGYCGLSRDTIREAIINANKEGANPVDSSAFLKQAEKFASRTYKIRTMGAINTLVPEDASSVLTYVDPDNSYKLDHSHTIFKTSTTLAELLNKFKQDGVLTPAYAESRPEIFKDAVKKSSGIITP